MIDSLYFMIIIVLVASLGYGGFVQSMRCNVSGPRQSETLLDLFSLRDRRAVVTGAAGGLGRAICRRLAEAGVRTVLGDINGDAAGALSSEIERDFGTSAVGVRVDVTDSRSVAQLAARAVDNFSGIDIWINNAAIFPRKPTLEMSHEEWDAVLAVNLKGAFLGSREAARQMVAQGEAGHRRVILNIASLSGMRGRPQLVHYVASKHGVVGLTKTLAIEFGPLDIRVVGIAPGRLAKETSPAIAGRPADSERLSEIPLGRLVTNDDVARTAIFLASDLAESISGCTIPVDGGRSAF